MRKNITFALAVLSAQFSFSTQAEFNSSIGFSIPVDDDKRMVRDISAIKYNYGLRLNIGSTIICGNAKLTSTKIKDFYDSSPKDLFNSQEYTYGLQQSVRPGVLKFDFLCGNLSFSNSINRLKNPTITCPNPLKNGSTINPGITPSLPTASSAKTSFSYGATLSPKSQEIMLPSIQFAILDSGEKYWAVFKNFSTSLIPKVLVAFSGGTFFHEYNKENGWFQDERYYQGAEFFSGETTLAFLWKSLKTTSSVGLYENPFGGIRQWYRNQSFISIGIFSLGIYYFDSDEDIITASGNHLNTGQQIFLTPQLKFRTGKGLTAFGATLGQNSRKQKKRISSQYNQYYIKLGVSYTSMNFSLNGNCSINYSTQTLKENRSYSLNAAVPFNFLKFNTGFNYSSDGEDSKTYKISEKMIFRKKIIENIYTTWTWKEGEESRKWNLDTGVSFSKKTRRIKANGKITFSFQKLS